MQLIAVLETNKLKRQFALVRDLTKFSLGGNREEEIPEPIPNSEVKLFIADGTILKSMGE